MMRGAVHGLIHNDRRYLDVWSLHLVGLELRPLAATTPTPFSAVFVARAHELDGRPLPLLVIRRRWVGHGMREVIELHNSGRDHHELEVVLEVGADFAHLFDVKASRGGEDGTIRPSDGHWLLEPPCTTWGRLRSRPASPARRPRTSRTSTLGWWFDVPAHGRRPTFTVEPIVDGIRAGQPFPIGTTPADAVPLRRLEAWHAAAPTLDSNGPPPRRRLSSRRSPTSRPLRIVDARAPRPAVVAAGAPWFMTLFGRDSLLDGLDAAAVRRRRSRGACSATPGRAPGHGDDPASEEQPGQDPARAPPSRRRRPVRGRAAATTAPSTPRRSSSTSPPRPGDGAALDERRPPRWRLPSTRALDWLLDPGDSDGDGFVDYRRDDATGLLEPGLEGLLGRDHASPTARCRRPRSRSSRCRATCTPRCSARPSSPTSGRGPPTRRSTREAPSCRTGSTGRSGTRTAGSCSAPGRGRVDSLTTNPGHALWSGIAEDDHADRYLDRLGEPELWTGWGVRTLATSMAAYDPLSYHNGSVWPHDTALCAAGAARYGRWDVVDLFVDGLLDARYFGGRPPELFAGLARGVVPCRSPTRPRARPRPGRPPRCCCRLRANLGMKADASRRTVEVEPRGRIAADLSCDRLVVGGRLVSITCRGGVVAAQADGVEVVDVRDHSRRP